MVDRITQLSQADIELLDKLLFNRVDEDAFSPGMDEGVFDISTLDGMFTAIVSGPVAIVPSDWLPAIWGDFEPEWENTEDFECCFSLLMQHMNSISDTLLHNPDEFAPIFMEQSVDGETYTIVDDWCEGYCRGVVLTEELWDTSNAEMAELLGPIVAFSSTTDWAGHDFDEEEAEAIRDIVTLCAVEIHAYWLARRDEFQRPDTKPVHRAESRIERNDPCPCGSGKKYKKCCLN
jgi:uncharacterized protein